MFKRKKRIEEDMIFTHNCAARIVAGRLENTPSMMALGSTLGTTIDGKHKGAGMTKMQGQISRVQYYFETQNWIKDTYFAQRGLDDSGYTIGADMNTEDIILEGDIELDDYKSTTTFEFDDEKTEIQNRKDQRFEEI